MKTIQWLTVILVTASIAVAEPGASVRIAFAAESPSQAKPIFESPFSKVATVDFPEAPPMAEIPAPINPEAKEQPEAIQRLMGSLGKQNAANEARILEVLSEIRSTGPKGTRAGYSRAEVAVLAELGDYLKELTGRRERFRRVAAFLETPHLNRFVDEKRSQSGGRELASDKAERYEGLGLQSAPNLKHLRNLSRTQLSQRAKELRPS